MKILTIMGSKPSDGCGVASFAQTLEEYLLESDIDTVEVVEKNWRLSNLWSILKRVSGKKVSIVHMHYPMQGYAKYFAPIILPLLLKVMGHKVILTLHEFSQAGLKGKLWRFPLVFADTIISTTSFEAQALQKTFPFVASKNKIIRIGSSIPYLKAEKKISDSVVLFGLIIPNRGFEDFLELAEISKNQKLPYNFSIVGSISEGFEAYYDELRRRSDNLSVTWYVGLKNLEVAQVIAKHKYAYLPFPDGASERRTSLLTCLGNGNYVVTTRGRFSTPDLLNAVFEAKTPLHALLILMSKDFDGSSQKLLVNQFINKFEWNLIVNSYIEEYNKLNKNDKKEKKAKTL